MADAVALLAAAALVAAAMAAVGVRIVRLHREIAAARERQRIEAPAAAAAEAARTERYISAVNAAESSADLEGLAREFGSGTTRRNGRRASSTDKRNPR